MEPVERELLPLGSGFDVVRRGYDRAQVEEHLDRLDADLRILAADRDAAITQSGELSRQLDTARVQVEDLRGQVERLAAPPTTMEGLNERLQRMLRLAREEARDIHGNAQAEAARLVAEGEQAGEEAHTRHDARLAELERRRVEMQDEHGRLMEQAQADAERIRREAAEERDRLGEADRARRAQVDEDFEIAMGARRTEAMRTLAQVEAASKAEARRRIEEATAEAYRRVREASAEAQRRTTEADRRVQTLRELRGRVAEQLRHVYGVLAEVPGTITEMDDEQHILDGPDGEHSGRHELSDAHGTAAPAGPAAAGPAAAGPTAAGPAATGTAAAGPAAQPRPRPTPRPTPVGQERDGEREQVPTGR